MVQALTWDDWASFASLPGRFGSVSMDIWSN
jgi:hypothetical protein